jgi:hypothetical protein
MSSSISHATTSVSLAAFSIIITLTTKRTLVDLTFLRTAEWHAIVFKLQKYSWVINQVEMGNKA